MRQVAMQWVIGATLVLALAGCAGFGGHRDAVRVTVAAVEVVESTVFEQLYRVTLRVQNRGESPIQIRGGSFDLAINGRDFGSGVTDSVLEVPPYADATLDVRMVSTLFGMVRLFQGLAEPDSSTLRYEISGRFSTDNAIGGLGFREEGEIAMPQRGTGNPDPAAEP